MAPHRYWRAVALQSYGGDLELGSFHLRAARTRVDAAATLTASIAPGSGSVANLQDTTAGTTARWASVAVPSLVLQWDFGGGPVDVDDIRLSGPEHSRFLSVCVLQFSDDAATWTRAFDAMGIAWPGSNVETVSTSIGAWDRLDNSDAGYLDQDASRLVVLNTTQTAAVHTAARSAGVLQVEFVVDGAVIGHGVGVGRTNISSFNGTPGGQVGQWVWRDTPGAAVMYSNGVSVGSYGSVAALGDVIGMKLDFTAGQLTFYKNGVSQGVAASGLGGLEFYPIAGPANANSVTRTVKIQTDNFTYPIAGATPWTPGERIRQRAGVVRLPSRPAIYGTPPPLVFGTPLVQGSIKGRYDYIYGGTGRVRGTVKEKNTPVNTPLQRRTRLVREVDGQMLREQWSDATTGAYDFQDVPLGEKYTVISYDYAHNYRAVVADNLTPEVMP